MASESGDSSGCAGWFKWLVGIFVALLAAGGGIVALLEFVSSETPSAPPVVTAPPEPPAETAELWINDIETEVELVREEADASQIWNWIVTVDFEAQSDFFVRFEIWAFGVDANNNETSHLIDRSVHESGAGRVTLPNFWTSVVLEGESPWRVDDIVHVEELTLRAVSVDDGTVLDERDFMRHPR